MKLRIEIANGLPDEVLIRASEYSNEIRRLQEAFEAASGPAEIGLDLGNTTHFVPISDILFFETDNGKITAHTSDNMYYSDEKLYSLQKMLPRCFVKISKSCIVNSAKIESVSRNLTGTGEAHFYGSHKQVFISRMYYKVLIENIKETRLSK